MHSVGPNEYRPDPNLPKETKESSLNGRAVKKVKRPLSGIFSRLKSAPPKVKFNMSEEELEAHEQKAYSYGKNMDGKVKDFAEHLEETLERKLQLKAQETDPLPYVKRLEKVNINNFSKAFSRELSRIFTTRTKDEKQAFNFITGIFHDVLSDITHDVAKGALTPSKAIKEFLPRFAEKTDEKNKVEVGRDKNNIIYYEFMIPDEVSGALEKALVTIMRTSTFNETLLKCFTPDH